jgi:hypothetical protein
MEVTNEDWAKAIAERICDESDLKQNFPEDAELLSETLTTLLSQNPWAVDKLIGTGIIEADYFNN